MTISCVSQVSQSVCTHKLFSWSSKIFGLCSIDCLLLNFRAIRWDWGSSILRTSSLAENLSCTLSACQLINLISKHSTNNRTHLWNSVKAVGRIQDFKLDSGSAFRAISCLSWPSWHPVLCRAELKKNSTQQLLRPPNLPWQLQPVQSKAFHWSSQQLDRLGVLSPPGMLLRTHWRFPSTTHELPHQRTVASPTTQTARWQGLDKRLA